MLFTLHGEICFNEYTVCKNKKRTGAEDATLILPKLSAAYTGKFGLSEVTTADCASQKSYFHTSTHTKHQQQVDSTIV